MTGLTVVLHLTSVPSRLHRPPNNHRHPSARMRREGVNTHGAATPRISASAMHPARLAQSQWQVGVCFDPNLSGIGRGLAHADRLAGEIIVPFCPESPRRAIVRFPPRRLVSAGGGTTGGLGRATGAAAFRRSGPRRHRLGERPAGHHPHWRLYSLSCDITPLLTRGKKCRDRVRPG